MFQYGEKGMISVMKRILKYISKYWYLYFFSALSMLISIGLDMFNPIVTGRIIDEVVEGGKLEIFQSLIVALLGITLGRAIFGYAKEILFDTAGVRIVCRLRQEMFDHIQSLSFGFFERKNTGELMARIKEDADSIWVGISFGGMLAIEQAIYLIVATVLMLTISVKLSILALITLPILSYVALQLEKKIGKIYESISEQNAVLNTTAQENIAGVRLVKAFAREKYEVSKFLSHNKKYYDLNMQQAKVTSKYFPILEFITNLLPVLVITFGGALVVGEDLSIGMLIRFSGYIYMVIWPMRLMGWLSNIIAEARAALKKIDTIFSEEPEIKNVEHPIDLVNCKGEVEFKNVSLTLNETQVLRNVSFKLNPGKTLAIMGATGTGKTSIINLLLRFYDVTTGEITIDGHEIKNIDLKCLRKEIAFVMQDVFLFSDTIEENIKFGSKDSICDDSMIHSAKSACAHDFIDKLSEKYSTVIGERGIGLSGGQKQRISISRAFAKEASILILDDATSALDMETEHDIQKKIDKLTHVSKIIVAHRISAVKNADEIIILENGRIVERGTHSELLSLKGRYYTTFNEQYEGYLAEGVNALSL